MNRRLWFAAPSLLLLFVSGVTSAPGQQAPRSGFLYTVSYGVTGEEKRRVQRDAERVWFDGERLRRDFWVGEDLTRVEVRGPSCWYAYPAAGWVMDSPWPEGVSPYLEEVRRRFADGLSRQPVRKTARLKGIPCWVYTVPPAARAVGEGGSPAEEITCWVYADPQFPALLHAASQSGVALEMLGFWVNRPVPAEVFKKPTGLKPIRPFFLPKRSCLIETESDRVSRQHGWTQRGRYSFRSSGSGMVRRYSSITIYPGQEPTTFSPPDEAITSAEAAGWLWPQIQTPSWETVRKVGEEEVLGLPADVLETLPRSATAGVPFERYWVVNHPVLGTVTVKKTSTSGEEVSTFRVTQTQGVGRGSAPGVQEL